MPNLVGRESMPDAKQFRVLLPPPTYERLRRRAFSERRSMASLARLLIETGLKRKRNAPAVTP